MCGNFSHTFNTLIINDLHSPSKLACVCWCLWAPTSTACISTPNMVTRHPSTQLHNGEDWSSASVVNHTIVTDPTIWQPGFDLPYHSWSLVNRFQTGQAPCHTNLHKMGSCPITFLCLWPATDMNHMVNTCPLTKFEGGLNLLHEAVIWLEFTLTAKLAK